MEFRIITEEDHELAIQHLRSTFFIDEPLNKAVQLCPNGEGHQELEKQCVDTMRDGYSIIAIENGIVLGVSLNGVLHPGDTTKALAKLKLLNDHKFSKIFTMLYSITDDLELFKKYDVEKIFECRIMSVDSRARGKGLATDLFRRAIQLAKDNGFKIMKGDATGAYSQKMAEGLGFGTLIELNYKDYLDPGTGLPVFEVPTPHETLKIMTKRLTD
ncbi:arylalkylamine N-acetyltransferase 1-like [Arctopsyche grandis]|uniref:arylalkylamine N-acetyltransferase 1-like n=1 Tax=Arctopsyche grandis TaxID=121162 RepID=UPI00406D7D3F